MIAADADHQVIGELWDWLPDQIGQEVSVPLRVLLQIFFLTIPIIIHILAL